MNVLCSALTRIAAQHSRSNPILTAALTGVAACKINSRTLHSLLRLPVQRGGGFEALSGPNLSRLQENFRHVRYLILDEKSMIGLGLMGMISNRLLQAHPDVVGLDLFGDISVILLGDFHQLPPVFDRPLFDTRSLGATIANQLQLAGRSAYYSINKTIRLETIIRQQGGDPTTRAFRDTLNALRNMSCSSQQWELLGTRCRGKLSEVEVRSFDTAVRVYPTNAQVDAYNFQHLNDLQSPVINIKATGSGTD